MDKSLVDDLAALCKANHHACHLLLEASGAASGVLALPLVAWVGRVWGAPGLAAGAPAFAVVVRRGRADYGVFLTFGCGVHQRPNFRDARRFARRLGTPIAQW